ncbi:MAG: TOBE domain-containing protein [Deltaproteobacteria bacterium]|jgi:molybdate transport system regulatory protein|nr:TOBE domain-containing protein [Deltaproteobacteria bacterium]
MHKGVSGLKNAEQDIYTVAEGVKYMTSDQLSHATQIFRQWFQSSRTPIQTRSRGRIWMSFLLFRYAALRLGELLALDDLRDIDTEGRSVTVSGANARAISLPADIADELAGLLNLPMFYSLRGKIFNIDQGYLRRKFYERAVECAIPGFLLNPRVTRQSRGIELLRAGMPAKAVQIFMGWQSQDHGIGSLVLSNDASRQIMEQFLEGEIRKKTSARNVFAGMIESVICDGVLAEVRLVTASGLRISSVITEESLHNLGLGTGRSATASVKAPFVFLQDTKEICGGRSGALADLEPVAAAAAKVQLYAENTFVGKVTRVAFSEIAAEILVDLPDGHKVCALLGRKNAERLGLRAGSDVRVIFRSLAVVLNV